MKARKVISLVLAAILCLGLFAGCTPADNDKPGETNAPGDYSGVEFMVAWWGGDARHNYTMDALEVFDEQFTNLRTSVVYSGWGDYFNTIIDVNMAGGNPPDVFQVTFDKIPLYASAGKLMKLDSYIDNGDIDTANVADSSIQMGAYNGNIYAIPTGISTSVYAFISHWGDFYSALIYLNKPEYYPVAYALKLYADEASVNYGPMLAMSVLSITPIIILFFLFQKTLVDGISTSGIKG